MKKRTLNPGSYLLLLFVFLFTGAVAQNPPPAVASYIKDTTKYSYTEVPGDPLKTRIYKMRNGLTVFLTVNKREPRVQTLVAVKAGSQNDPADNTGLAHYLEHMLFKGTSKYGTMNFHTEEPLLNRIEGLYETYRNVKDPEKRKVIYKLIDSLSYIASKYAIANEYDKMMQIIGAQGTNAFTSTDATVYINDVPSNQLEKWIEIEGERFRHPVFRLFHTELEAVYEEKNISMDNDDNKSYEALMERVFQGHPYGHQTTIGTVEHLKNPSLKEIRKYYEKFYVPNNMAIIMSGDFNPDVVIEQIYQAFFTMSPREVPPNFPAKYNMDGTPKTTTIKGPNAENVMIGFPMPKANSDDMLLLYLSDMLLANSKAGLIDINLNKAQKVLSASSYLLSQKEGSMHILQGFPKEGQTLEEVKNLLMEQIEKIKRGEFDEETMKAIIANDEVDEINNYKTNSGRAFELLDAFSNEITWEKYLANKQKLKEIRKEDIVKFANAWYRNNYAVVYKVTGEDTAVEKIEKPAITPVELNKKEESGFVQNIAAKRTAPLTPVFLDFDKDIVKTKLSKDIPVHYIQNKENQLFTLYYILDMGRLNDLKTGFAINLLPYLGTEKYSSSELSAAFYKLACNFGVSSGDNRMYVYLSGPDKNFDAALELFEHLISNVKPDQVALNSLVDRTLKSREDAKLDKGTILFSAMMNYAKYGKKNPFTYRLSEKELKALKAEELTAKIKDLFNYKHSVFYFGPQQTDALVKVLDVKHISGSLLKDYPKEKIFKPLPAPKKNLVYFTDYEMVQAEVLWLRNAGMFNEKMLPSISVFNEYFDGGMGSIVFQELRESKALAYSTFASYGNTSRKDKPSFIMGYIGTQSDKLFDAIPAMNNLFNTPATNASSLEVAKKSLKQSIENNRIVETNIFFSYLAAKDLGLTNETRKNLYYSIDNFKIDDVAKFQTENFKDKAFIYCVIGSEKRIDRNNLKAVGKVKVLKLEEIFGY